MHLALPTRSCGPLRTSCTQPLYNAIRFENPCGYGGCATIPDLAAVEDPWQDLRSTSSSLPPPHHRPDPDVRSRDYASFSGTSGNWAPALHFRGFARRGRSTVVGWVEREYIGVENG